VEEEKEEIEEEEEMEVEWRNEDFSLPRLLMDEIISAL
jgi:DNA-directed RNA polymerase subunit L